MTKTKCKNLLKHENNVIILLKHENKVKMLLVKIEDVHLSNAESHVIIEYN